MIIATLVLLTLLLTACGSGEPLVEEPTIQPSPTAIPTYTVPDDCLPREDGSEPCYFMVRFRGIDIEGMGFADWLDSKRQGLYYDVINDTENDFVFGPGRPQPDMANGFRFVVRTSDVVYFQALDGYPQAFQNIGE